MIGQISLDGEELTGYKVVTPGLGALEWPQDEELHRTDRITVTLELVVYETGDGAPVDSQGISKSPVGRTYYAAIDKSSLKVAGVARKAEMVEATG